jgi:hypothetical protein
MEQRLYAPHDMGSSMYAYAQFVAHDTCALGRSRIGSMCGALQTHRAIRVYSSPRSPSEVEASEHSEENHSSRSNTVGSASSASLSRVGIG